MKPLRKKFDVLFSAFETLQISFWLKYFVVVVQFENFFKKRTKIQKVHNFTPRVEKNIFNSDRRQPQLHCKVRRRTFDFIDC